LPATSPNAFTVSWTGTAYTPSGCAANGIASYIVWYQVNGGGFIKWLDGVSYTSAQFNAASLGIGNGSVVGFRSQAVDYYGNKTPAGNATATTTISSIEPTAYINALPTWTTSPTFQVGWNGNAQGGPAITSYNLQVNVNNGGWQTPFLLTNTPQTSFQYSGANGNNYQFRVQASNNNGASFGPWSAVVSTSVDNTPPATTVDTLPQYTTSTSFWVSWSGTDSGSGVASYSLQYQLGGGPWVTLISNTPQTSFYMQNAQTGKYGFRVQAVDYAGNVQAWPANAQASTTVLVNPLALIKPFSPPIVQSVAPVAFTVSWQGYTPPGTQLTGYTVKYRYNSGAWQTMGVYPAAQTSATFTATLGDGIYQFQATASNDAGAPSVELPEAYWQMMIVDSAHQGSITFLPLIAQNAQ
jgi:hypothetical protein